MNRAEATYKFFKALKRLVDQGVIKTIDQAKDFAKQEFGEVSDLMLIQVNKIFKNKGKADLPIKPKDPVFDNTVEKLPYDDQGVPFNRRDPQKVYGKPKANQNRAMTADEYDDFVEEVGGGDQLEAYNFDGTVGDAKRILKEQEDRMKYMYDQYKMGKLDPVAGDKSPARKRFLEKKMEESLMSGDSKLMNREEIDELYNFDLGTEMDKMKIDDDIDISQGMIDLDEMNFTKNAQAAKDKIDNTDVNKEIKKGVAEIMSDTSPAALKKSIEVDDLMLKYPGMSRELAKQIASDPDPARKAQVISMVEQTIKMGDEGMSGDEIIDIFKKGTDRTKQAKGGRIKMAKGGLPNILGF